jgi:Ca-activated chloride channel homolog
MVLHLKHPAANIRILCCTFVMLGAVAFVSGQDSHPTQAPLKSSSNTANTALIRDNVDLVLVNVTVLDQHDQIVTGLAESDFQVFDNGKPANLKYMSKSDEPASVVVIFDGSASMRKKISGAKNAVHELLKGFNTQDEVSIIVVGDKPRITFNFTDSFDKIEQDVGTLEAHGQTALWDSAYLGLEQLRNSRNQKRAIVVVSDGGDNHSRYPEAELRRFLEEADVPLYAITLRAGPPPVHSRAFGIYDPLALGVDEQIGGQQLDELSAATGGRAFSVEKPIEVSRAAAQISQDIQNEYILGYYTGSKTFNGKWHRLKVEMSRQASKAKFRIYAKKGYYAAAN